MKGTTIVEDIALIKNPGNEFKLERNNNMYLTENNNITPFSPMDIFPPRGKKKMGVIYNDNVIICLNFQLFDDN